MANLTGFDANTVPPREDFTPLPSGEYRVQITESEMKPTRKADGNYLECTYEVADGEFKGRKLWSRHNLDNPNPKASEIAQRELSAICHAVGVLKPIDSQQLHYKPLIVRVEFVEAGGNREKATNDIKAWKAIEGAVAGGQASTSAAAAPTASGSPAPPWAQKNAA